MEPTIHRRVLITGAAGYIAEQVLPTLRTRYECVLTDTRTHDRHGHPVPGVQVADLTTDDLDALRPLFREVSCVVHLAYIQPRAGQAAALRENYRIERRNVDMAFNVYQLALEEGVRRVVMASSNHAADWYEGLIHARRKDMVDPWERAVSDNFYGWAKEAYEHLGFVFAAGRLGRALEVIQLRIGAPREIIAERYGGDAVAYHRDLGAHISPRDLTQLIVRSVEAEEIRDRYGIPFQIFYGISDNTRKFWSITNAREVIGYVPEDDSEAKYRDDIHRVLTSSGAPIPPRDFNPGPGYMS